MGTEIIVLIVLVAVVGAVVGVMIGYNVAKALVPEPREPGELHDVLKTAINTQADTIRHLSDTVVTIGEDQIRRQQIEADRHVGDALKPFSDLAQGVPTGQRHGYMDPSLDDGHQIEDIP